MRSLIIFISTAFLFSSCSNTNSNAVKDTAMLDSGNVASGIPRLAIYYPLDSVDANGKQCYRTIPDVELLAQNNKPFSFHRVSGKVVITDFFFASCEGICPKMTNQLTRVQAAFRNDTMVKLLSYTVDPARDSSETLMAYSKRFNADTNQWTFLTGDKKKIYDLARYAYFLPVQPGTGNSEDFIHSDQMILIDQNAHIRGYYSGTDSAEIDSLIVDIRTLLKEK